MPKIAKAAKKLKKLRYHRYAVRIGRQPGIYATYLGEDGAEPQVNGYPGCHMGFTKAQCERALHHMYVQKVLDDSQISKLAAGQLLAGPDGVPTEYTPKPYSYHDVDGTWPYTPQTPPPTSLPE